MELERSLPCSQEPATGTYPQRDRCNLLRKIHFNIILFKLSSFQWSLSFMFCDRNLERIFHSYECHGPFSFSLIYFIFIIFLIVRQACTLKIFPICNFVQPSVTSHIRKSKYYPVLKHPQCTVQFLRRDRSEHSAQQIWTSAITEVRN